MKRASVAFAGFAFGLLLTWLCLYVVSHVDWPLSDEPAVGCREIDKCPVPRWAMLLLLADLLVAPALFGILNAVAWQRWPMNRWIGWFGGLTLLTAAYRVAGYAFR